jgi:hypothetical protein
MFLHYFKYKNEHITQQVRESTADKSNSDHDDKQCKCYKVPNLAQMSSQTASGRIRISDLE